jgi:hypothetical protein
MYNYETLKIDLPSKGKVYPIENSLSKGFVEMRYMTAKHEDILTNPNKINKGLNYLINEFAKSLIVDEKINYEDLIDGDSFQLILASRILSYGHLYKFTYKEKDYTIDLSQLPDKELESKLYTNKNEFDLTLPISGIDITLKLLTIGDSIKIEEELKELEKKFPEENFKRYVKLKHMIQSVDKDYDKINIESFIDNALTSWDIRTIFDFHREISPDVDITFKPDSMEGTVETIPFSYFELFFPDKRI